MTETLIDLKCPLCGSSAALSRIVDPCPAVVRGHTFTVDRIRRKCPDCQEVFSHSLDPDWRAAAHELYRVEKRMLTAAEILEWRTGHGMTQCEMSDLLGWGAGTLARYENGYLQTDAHEACLRAIMRP